MEITSILILVTDVGKGHQDPEVPQMVKRSLKLDKLLSSQLRLAAGKGCRRKSGLAKGGWSESCRM